MAAVFGNNGRLLGRRPVKADRTGRARKLRRNLLLERLEDRQLLANINVSLSGYIRFIQLQLQGLKGNSTILPQEIFDRLLYGLPVFSFGWFNEVDGKTKHHIAFNEGNAGAFITRAEIIKDVNRAYIGFTN